MPKRTPNPHTMSHELLDRRGREIAEQMKVLGKKIEAGNDSQLLLWILPDRLACSHRPLRHHPLYGGSGKNISSGAEPLLHDWTKRMHDAGIQSILSLMHDKEAAYYSALDLGAPDLFAFYKTNGFVVERVPWEDPAHSHSPEVARTKSLLSVRTEAFRAFQGLPKPVVLQCSAGRDRSAPVAAFIEAKVSE